MLERTGAVARRPAMLEVERRLDDPLELLWREVGEREQVAAAEAVGNGVGHEVQMVSESE